MRLFRGRRIDRSPVFVEVQREVERWKVEAAEFPEALLAQQLEILDESFMGRELGLACDVQILP